MIYHFRPHHMLCTRFFEGHGYSKEFTDNMANILNSIDEDTKIEIVKGKDDLCTHCPNHKLGFCTSFMKVHRYDRLTLKELNIHYGDILNYKAFVNTYNPHEVIKKTCTDCKWYSICLNHK